MKTGLFLCYTGYPEVKTHHNEKRQNDSVEHGAVDMPHGVYQLVTANTGVVIYKTYVMTLLQHKICYIFMLA